MKLLRMRAEWFSKRVLLSLLIPVFIISFSSSSFAAGANIPYSFFLEHPYSITGMKNNVEFVDLDNDGWLIMNNHRVDINIYQNLFGVYGEFPFAGVTDFGPNDDGDYAIGNIAVGGKFALLNLDQAVLTVGAEVLFPTASDNVGASAALNYFRDYASFAHDAWTVAPYAVLGVSGGIFALQANVEFDILFDANNINDPFVPINTGNDDTQLIIKYGGAVSITPDLSLPFSTSFLVEVILASSTTFDDNITAGYVTPGIRLGGQIISVGAGVQIPFGSDEVTDFANVDILIDLIIRFGT